MAGKTQKYLTFDVESGGVSCRKHMVTQIGAEVWRGDTLTRVENFEIYIKPYDKNDEALGIKKKKVLKKKNTSDEEPVLMDIDYKMTERICGITENMLYSKGVELDVAVNNFIAFISKHVTKSQKTGKPLKSGRLVLAAQNSLFDIGFLQQIFEFTEHKISDYFAGSDDFYGNFQPMYLDTLLLGRLQTGDMELSHKLGDIAERNGIEIADAHNASSDVEATTDILVKFANRIRSNADGDATQQRKTRDDFYFKIKENEKDT